MAMAAAAPLASFVVVVVVVVVGTWGRGPAPRLASSGSGHHREEFLNPPTPTLAGRPSPIYMRMPLSKVLESQYQDVIPSRGWLAGGRAGTVFVEGF